MKTRVVVAMSGGVDSSVAALLLKEQGYDVIGISLKLWEGETSAEKKGRTCCSYEDIRDARSVCEQLDIPFYAFNYQREFRQNVVDPFAMEYFGGKTPNPCILCNSRLKFDRLLEEAQKLGASFLATGHYARIFGEADGTRRLLKGRDASKDQSYVLYKLSQSQLKKILFPVGDFSKDEIRDMARRSGMATAGKKESMDICFIPRGDRSDFFKKYYPDKKSPPGNFVDSKGSVLGRHQGIDLYTVGQRRGLEIGFGTRLYVKRIDPILNEVELAPLSELVFSGLVAAEINWVAGNPSDEGKCGVKIRYQKDEIPSRWKWAREENRATVYFDGDGAVPGTALFGAVSPGQAAVFYDGDEVLGGGTIVRALA